MYNVEDKIIKIILKYKPQKEIAANPVKEFSIPHAFTVMPIVTCSGKPFPSWSTGVHAFGSCKNFFSDCFNSRYLPFFNFITRGTVIEEQNAMTAMMASICLYIAFILVSAVGTIISFKLF